MTQLLTEPHTRDTIVAPGASLYYEVRGTGPAVLLIGNPMDATAFAPLAELLAVDHTVITTDPRGINRSPLQVPGGDVPPEVRADDLALVLTQVDAGPAVVVGSSGGAVSALSLALRHPRLVHTVVAHEPPLEELLPDREERRAATDDMIATYESGDVAGAWAKFLSEANIELSADDQGPALPADPDPQPVADEKFFFQHLLRPTTRWQPDIEQLRTGSPRIVVGIGAESAGQVCDLTSRALAAALGGEPVLFPGDHIGFLVVPEPFAARLRATLNG